MKRTQERWLEAEERRVWMTLFFQDSERQEILAEMKEKHGIEPLEVAAFSFLVAKRGRRPLTEEQMRLWEKLARKKLPATEIYQQIFGGVAGAKVFSKVKEDFRTCQTVKSIN
jgi:hypothetical protein